MEITDRAKEQLFEVLSSKVDNLQASLRMVTTGDGQFGLHIDVPTENDIVWEYNGKNILVMNNQIATALEGLTLDIESTVEGMEFSLLKASDE